jgi:hypothetical protein
MHRKLFLFEGGLFDEERLENRYKVKQSFVTTIVSDKTITVLERKCV